jgi:hypothetical protein
MPYKDPEPYDYEGHRVEIKVHFLPEGVKLRHPYWIASIDGEPMAPQLSEELARRLAEEKIRPKLNRD